MRKLKLLHLPNGKSPYVEWLLTLPVSTQARIDVYLDRVLKGGSKKNIKVLGDGVYEIKMPFGPGYRVYFAELNKLVLLILLGGNKASQKSDIRKAKFYWSEYNVSNK